MTHHRRRLFIFLALTFSVISNASASDEHTILKLSNNAWVTRSGLTNRASVSAGDKLKNGDSLETLRGNTAVIRLAESPRNLVYIGEETALMVDDSLGGRGFKVFRGKVTVSVEKTEPLRPFKVTCPTAIAAVRGTQFAVDVKPSASAILGYSGAVEVTRRLLDGSISKDSISLKPGEKVIAEEGSEEPLRSEPMSAEEIAGIETILRMVPPAEEPVMELITQAVPGSSEKEEKKDDVIVDSYIVSSEDQDK